MLSAKVVGFSRWQVRPLRWGKGVPCRNRAYLPNYFCCDARSGPRLFSHAGSGRFVRATKAEGEVGAPPRTHTPTRARLQGPALGLVHGGGPGARLDGRWGGPGPLGHTGHVRWRGRFLCGACVSQAMRVSASAVRACIPTGLEGRQIVQEKVKSIEEKEEVCWRGGDSVEGGEKVHWRAKQKNQLCS